MARHETVTYECDWCTRTAPAYGKTEHPVEWMSREYEGELLCTDCVTERTEALANAKAIRRARQTGQPVKTVQARPSEASIASPPYALHVHPETLMAIRARGSSIHESRLPADVAPEQMINAVIVANPMVSVGEFRWMGSEKTSEGGTSVPAAGEKPDPVDRWSPNHLEAKIIERAYVLRAMGVFDVAETDAPDVRLRKREMEAALDASLLNDLRRGDSPPEADAGFETRECDVCGDHDCTEDHGSKSESKGERPSPCEHGFYSDETAHECWKRPSEANDIEAAETWLRSFPLVVDASVIPTMSGRAITRAAVVAFMRKVRESKEVELSDLRTRIAELEDQRAPDALPEDKDRAVEFTKANLRTISEADTSTIKFAAQLAREFGAIRTAMREHIANRMTEWGLPRAAAMAVRLGLAEPQPPLTPEAIAHGEKIAQRLDAERTASPDAVRDACEECGGAKGGVPGNENIINGRVLCDYCTAAARTTSTKDTATVSPTTKLRAGED